MTCASGECDIEHIEFLFFKEVELEEIREILAVWTDLGSKTELAKFVLSLHKHLILIGQKC